MSGYVQSPLHIIEVWGDFACFTRPELSVERFSYPCPTPSAARGIFEAIYFKPEFYWQVKKIELLCQPTYMSLRRNEVKDKVNTSAVHKWIEGKGEIEPIWADADKTFTGTDEKGRTQRQTMALKNFRCRLSAHIVTRSSEQREQNAHDDQFIRRASQGKCFQQPYLGCREFVAFFRLIVSAEQKPSHDYTEDLGLMLYDVFDLRKRSGGDARPFITLFRARLQRGVLTVPSFQSPEVLKPEAI